MGRMYDAMCRCGYIARVFLGSSGLSFTRVVINLPALCEKCHEVKKINILQSKSCDVCGSLVRFYNDPSLQSKSKLEWSRGGDYCKISETKVFKMPETKCLCPKCKKMELEFLECGNWD